jgi:hypothetical protein
MALQSPGVEVTVKDESFYTPAAPGTTPLIVIATGQNKTNAAGTNTASGTLSNTVGKVYNITSQRDLVDFYGLPYFQKTASGNPIHGGERNEYGLLAAYSFLGVSNSAFILRADIDLDQLMGDDVAPGSNPIDGTWWVDTRTSLWGIHEWNGSPSTVLNGQTFTMKTPIVLTDETSSQIDQDTGAPAGIGSIGDYAIVFQTIKGSGTYKQQNEQIKLWYKSAGNGEVGVDGFPGGLTASVASGKWVLVGSQEWTASNPTITGSKLAAITSNTAGKKFAINGIDVTIGALNSTLSELVTTINGLGITGVGAREVNGVLTLYTDGVNDLGPGDSTLSNAIVITAGTATADNLAADLGITTGSYYGPALQQSPYTAVPEWKITDEPSVSDYATGRRPSGSVWIKTTIVGNGASIKAKRWSSSTLSWVFYDVPMYTSASSALYNLDKTKGGFNIPANSLYIQTNSEENSGWDTTPETATFRLWRRTASGQTTVMSPALTATSISTGNSTVTFSISETVEGVELPLAAKTISFAAHGTIADLLTLVDSINAAGFVHVKAEKTTNNEFKLSHKLGGDLRITDTTGTIAKLLTPLNLNTLSGTSNFYELPDNSVADFLVSNWQPFAASDFAASNTAPINDPEDNQLWYNTKITDVDVMIHNGKTWVGYRTETSPYFDIERLTVTPIVSASNPWSSDTRTGDLWISTAEPENYPLIYRYNANLRGAALSEKWELVDSTDQQSEAGILFADARYGDSGQTGNIPASIESLLVSNYLDPDAPDPALYPKGMLLWNLRRSGGNVKRFKKSHFNVTEDNPRYDGVHSPLGQRFVNGESTVYYQLDRWVTASANNEDGSGTFGRKAQRSVVVAALRTAINTSYEARDEERRNFNLLTCPGYPEVMGDLVNLNIERGLTSFVIGDTPLRLPADATSITDWGTNARAVVGNGDAGMVTQDEYLAVFYPNGITVDLTGNKVVVPASHMMLKTIALSDNVSHPWFAPAGTRRGAITNADSVGYIEASTSEYHTVALNEGQRDTLYAAQINPITYFVGSGHVNFGQKTRAKNASALDRINVSRLTVYLRIQLTKLSRPFIFEPNDKVTRDEIKQACESLLLELVSLRAISDYAVVCNESNNTPTRIDRNELWVDIAIVPTKAVEFIYIPLRVRNTGAI